MDTVVSKFGGAAMADAGRIRTSIDIIRAHPGPQVITVSAPGATQDGCQGKVTDQLLRVANLRHHDPEERECILGSLTGRFLGIMEELRIGSLLRRDFEKHFRELMPYRHQTVSRGEYWMARIMAEALGFRFLDARDMFRFDAHRRFSMEETRTQTGILAQALAESSGVVVPGFYGGTADGRIVLFPRNGSDLSGAILASLTGAQRYDIWKDTAVRRASPRIVPCAEVVEYLTYEEARELTSRGPEVVHSGAIHYAQEAAVPIRVLDLGRPEGRHTVISSLEAHPRPPRNVVSAVAGHRGCSLLSVSVPCMHETVGAVVKILSVLEARGVGFEHMPSSTDRVDLVIRTEDLSPHIGAIARGIERGLGPGTEVSYRHGLAIVCTVGIGLRGNPGLRARVFASLAGRGINTPFIDQGADEINLIVGVAEECYEEAVRIIHAHCT